MSLEKQIDTISSREDFVSFMHDLILNLKEESDVWENADLEDFLSAMAAWIEDMDGFYKNTGQQLPQQLNWKVLGQIFLAARSYE